MQAICHILAEIGDKLLNTRFGTHLWLGSEPECCRHWEQQKTIIYEMLQQELLIVELLPVAERRDQGGSCQAS